MFLTTHTRAGRALAAGIDIAIDFATLGEYRVITTTTAEGTSRSVDQRGPVARRAEDGATDHIWATGIEWSSPERTRATCSLPRARNRESARSRVRG